MSECRGWRGGAEVEPGFVWPEAERPETWTADPGASASLPALTGQRAHRTRPTAGHRSVTWPSPRPPLLGGAHSLPPASYQATCSRAHGRTCVMVRAAAICLLFTSKTSPSLSGSDCHRVVRGSLPACLLVGGGAPGALGSLPPPHQPFLNCGAALSAGASGHRRRGVSGSFRLPPSGGERLSGV